MFVNKELSFSNIFVQMYVNFRIRTASSKKIRGELLVKKQKNVGFCWNYMKNDCLTSLGCFERFLSLFNLFDLFSTGKIGKLNFWEFNNPLSLNIKNYMRKTQSAKTISPHVIRNLIKFSIKFIFVGTIFTLKILQILQFKGSSLLRPSQWLLGAKVLFLWNFLNIDGLTNLGDFKLF